MGQSIWGALAAGAAALLICQTILQIVYAAGNAGWATDAHTKRVLQLFGLTKADGAKHIILVRSECGLQAVTSESVCTTPALVCQLTCSFLGPADLHCHTA